MPNIQPKELLFAGARYLRDRPGVLAQVAINAASMKVTVPLDVLRYFADKLLSGKKNAPKDVLLEERAPGLHLAASVSAMGTPVRFGATVKIDSVDLSEDELRISLKLSEVALKLEAKSDSPVAALIQSGALDLSKPGNLVKFMPNRPAALIEADGDRIVIDLMKEKKFAENPKVRRILDLIAPVLSVRSIRTEDDALVIALKAKPSGVPQVISRARMK